ncbi:hypothetical protein [Sporisorium scitamineum]|nr:hypothetical protein [Sporisorium scitamineum]
MFGSSGGSALRTVAAGTALAGAGTFAATGAAIGAHKLFDSHEGEHGGSRSEDEGGRGGEYPQQVAPRQPVVGTAYRQQGVVQGGGGGGAVFPVGVLMSDGTMLPLQTAAQSSQYSQSGTGFVFPNSK